MQNSFVTTGSVQESLSHQLGSLKDAHGFNRWMFQQLEPWIRWGRVWEIGAGIGTLSQYLLPADHLLLSDIDEDYLKILQERFGTLPQVKVKNVNLEQITASVIGAEPFDTIISTNVFEHVENDHKAMRMLADTMASQTVLITLVPAHPFLYGAIDKAIGHYRRYTKQSLSELLESSGQEVLSLKYFNCVSALGWFVKYRLFNSTKISGNDVQMVERLLPILRLEDKFPLPFGQSLIAVSRKKAQ